jgi:hypothetical protein
MEPLTASIAKKVGEQATDVLRKESETFLNAVLGEPAKALGGLIADRINARRHANLVTITVEAKRKLDAAGVSPREVPLKIIHPMIEAASLEEDPDMQTRWANLLANAADPYAEALPPSFPRILSEMSSREARFLDRLYEHLSEAASQSTPPLELVFAKPLHWGDLLTLCPKGAAFDIDAFKIDLDSLLRLRLLGMEAALGSISFDRGISVAEDNEIYRLTSFGLLFVRTCRPK